MNMDLNSNARRELLMGSVKIIPGMFDSTTTRLDPEAIDTYVPIT
jgi:hypothetical protein